MRFENQPFLFPGDRGGTILIIALWSLIALVVLSVSLANIIYPQIGLAKFLEIRLLSPVLARSAYRQACLERSNDGTPDYDTLAELRCEQRNKSGSLEYAYELIDQESKININTASSEVIARLPGLDEETASAIVESEFRPFSVKEGLLLVKDLDASIFAQVRDLITVYTDGKVNINTAPAEVLQVLGLSEELAQTIVNYRRGYDGQTGTDDDGVFEDTGSILNNLRGFTILSVEEEQSILTLITGNLLCVKSNILEIGLQVEKDGKPQRLFNIIFESQAGGIKYWQEG